MSEVVDDCGDAFGVYEDFVFQAETVLLQMLDRSGGVSVNRFCACGCIHADSDSLLFVVVGKDKYETALVGGYVCRAEEVFCLVHLDAAEAVAGAHEQAVVAENPNIV